MAHVVNLALQGGGAHGAFTWGALDRILEDRSIEIEGITATSAGAMNAVALKHGWVEGGCAGARDWLERFWLRVAGLDGIIGEEMLDWLRHVWPSPALTSRLLELNPAVIAGDAVARVLSPYQFNPANFHPLRGIVEEMADPSTAASATGPKLFISATKCARRPAADLPGRRDHPRRSPRLGLPADALPGRGDRRPPDRAP